MSCNCFNKKIEFTNSESFDDRLNKSKCKCNSRFCVSENKSRFRVVSRDIEKVDKVKIDGCFLPSEATIKCDYLFICKSSREKDTYVFVELKGQDIDYAISQIRETINHFLLKGRLSQYIVRGVIVNSNTPSHTGTYRVNKIRLEKEMLKYFKDFRIEKQFRAMKYDPINDKFSGDL